MKKILIILIILGLSVVYGEEKRAVIIENSSSVSFELEALQHLYSKNFTKIQSESDITRQIMYLLERDLDLLVINTNEMINLKMVKYFCDIKDIDLKVIVTPSKNLTKLNIENINKYAEVWDYSSYYYNNDSHLLGNRIMEDIEKSDQHLSQLGEKERLSDLREKNLSSHLPILMYHHIEETTDGNNSAIVSRDKFENDMIELKAGGFTPILFEEAIEYVHFGKALPQNPIVITFDDGYRSNYLQAYPILEGLGMKAVIGVIGHAIGDSTYKDTDKAMIEHFSIEEGKEMSLSGIIELQNHSYDMHQVPYFDGEACRKGAVRRFSESPKEFEKAFYTDLSLMQDELNSMNAKGNIYIYPYGRYNQFTEKLLKANGLMGSVTVNAGINEIIQGDPSSLFQLKRYNVTEFTSILDIIEEIKKNISSVQ